MRILYITRKFPPSIGGMQTHNFELYKNISGTNHVTLIVWGYSQVFLPLFILACILKVCIERVFRLKQYDVVCIGDAVLAPLAYACKRLLGIPAVSVAHGLDVIFSFPPYQKIVIPCLKKLDRIICVSRNTKNECRARGVPEDALVVIPNGVAACPVVERHEALQRLCEEGFPIGKNSKIILTVARLVKRKGIAEFIEKTYCALSKKYPELTYIIVGDGPERKKIKKVLDKYQLHDRAMLTGKVSTEKLRFIYAASDIFIMPNIRVKDDVEGFGIVALDASSHSVPVVAFALEGITDAVRDGENGLLAPYQHYDILEERISMLLENDDLRKSLREKAKEFSKKFSWSEIAKKYLDVFKQTVSAQ